MVGEPGRTRVENRENGERLGERRNHRPAARQRPSPLACTYFTRGPKYEWAPLSRGARKRLYIQALSVDGMCRGLRLPDFRPVTSARLPVCLPPGQAIEPVMISKNNRARYAGVRQAQERKNAAPWTPRRDRPSGVLTLTVPEA